MAIEYEAREWKDDSVGGTPIDAASLNRMEGGISEACNAIDRMEAGGVSEGMISDGAVSEDKLSEGLRDFVSRLGDVEIVAKLDQPRNSLPTGWSSFALSEFFPDYDVAKAIFVAPTISTASSDSSGCAVKWDTTIGDGDKVEIYTPISQNVVINLLVIRRVTGVAASS